MIKKIAVIVFYVTIPVGIFILLGFAVESNKGIACRDFHVHVMGSHYFIDNSDVIEKVFERYKNLEGQPLRNVSLRNIEELVSNMYYVEESQVYRTIDGSIRVNAIQREPIARIINAHNESFYLDSNGRLMKVSNQYTARVIIVTGHISARYSPNTDIKSFKSSKELTSSQKRLYDLNKLIHFIVNNSFWNAWIDQIYVTRNGDFELIPKNGSHVIEFGKAEDIEEKFNKLLVFYQNGLTHVGWNSYRRINLKFKNQIVCSK
ncbi:MAG: hypothetical protein EA393_09400 [Bacteroidetes bacterium]|nr:MAG: hypothetical protein EA393_09400 [Bacteroidota bacterium]